MAFEWVEQRRNQGEDFSLITTSRPSTSVLCGLLALAEGECTYCVVASVYRLLGITRSKVDMRQKQAQNPLSTSLDLWLFFIQHHFPIQICPKLLACMNCHGFPSGLHHLVEGGYCTFAHRCVRMSFSVGRRSPFPIPSLFLPPRRISVTSSLQGDQRSQ